MTRDSGWQLLSAGRHIERLGFLCKVLELAASHGLLHPSPEEGSGFDALLTLFDSTITYQAQHQQRRELGSLLGLLVQDVGNPRSLAWIARSLRQRLDKLFSATGFPSDFALPAPESWSLQALMVADEEGRLPLLARQLSECSASVWAISDALSARYFVHAREHSVE